MAQLVKNLPAMQETWVQSLGWEDPLEMGKTTHSSILAWRIPWTVVHGVSKSQSQLSDLHFHFHYLLGLPRWCSGKQYTCQGGRHKQCGFDPWVGKISWRRKWQPTPIFLPGEAHGQRNLVGYSQWRPKNQTRQHHHHHNTYFSFHHCFYMYQ